MIDADAVDMCGSLFESSLAKTVSLSMRFFGHFDICVAALSFYVVECRVVCVA